MRCGGSLKEAPYPLFIQMLRGTFRRRIKNVFARALFACELTRPCCVLSCVFENRLLPPHTHDWHHRQFQWNPASQTLLNGGIEKEEGEKACQQNVGRTWISRNSYHHSNCICALPFIKTRPRAKRNTATIYWLVFWASDSLFWPLKRIEMPFCACAIELWSCVEWKHALYKQAISAEGVCTPDKKKTVVFGLFFHLNIGTAIDGWPNHLNRYSRTVGFYDNQTNQFKFGHLISL